MKVIGKSDQGYLIAASESEIGYLFGMSTYDDAWKAELQRQGLINYSGHRELVGMTINVSTAYSQLEWMRRRDREFDSLTKGLRELADQIQNTKPLFDVIIGDKSKAA